MGRSCGSGTDFEPRDAKYSQQHVQYGRHFSGYMNIFRRYNCSGGMYHPFFLVYEALENFTTISRYFLYEIELIDD